VGLSAAEKFSTVEVRSVAKADHDMAQALGVPVGTILALRTGPDAKLKKDLHWQEMEGGRIVFTADGLTELRALTSPGKKEGAGTDQAPETLPGPDAVPPAVPALQARLQIIRLCPNPLWVEVRTPENQRAQVGVRNNRVLTLSTRLLCDRQDDTWKCVHPGQARP